MQEYKVTAGGKTHDLDEPFFVLATQNPIEQEGTYPLPEAQLDRFMFNILIDYPDRNDEISIVEATTAQNQVKLKKVISRRAIHSYQNLVLRVPVASNVVEYAVDLVSSTRPGEKANDFINEWVDWGAGPRATQFLILGAKARAILDGRPSADIDDIKAMALPVLRHRVIPNFNAEAEGMNIENIISKLL
jgi:MoxR-like ATPase